MPARQRRLLPESVAVRWVVVIATVLGGLAAAIPIGQAVTEWWRDRAGGSSSIVDGATIEQGSPAADALVHRLFEASDGGGRLELDAILVATPTQAGGRATNGYSVFYNCTDGPGEPGADRCGVAHLFWESNPLPFQVRGGEGWHLIGTYSVALDAGKGQTYDASLVAFHLVSITG